MKPFRDSGRVVAGGVTLLNDACEKMERFKPAAGMLCPSELAR
jgi:hypothetical protein